MNEQKGGRREKVGVIPEGVEEHEPGQIVIFLRAGICTK